MIVGADRGVHIGGRAVALPIATGESFTQIVGARRQLHGIALFLERREHALHGGEHREIRRAAGIARIRREVEQDERDLALRAILATQRHQLRHALGHAVDTLGNRLRRRRLARLRLTLTTEYGGHNGPIQFGNGDLQRGLQRIQAARIVPPLLNGLELERLQCDVRDIEPTQHRLRGLGVVVRRTTHEREAREINHGIDRRLPLAVREVLLDGRARIECGGEGRHHPQSLALQGPNDRRIVRHVVGQQIRTTDEHTHRAHVRATMPWQIVQTLGHPAIRQRRMPQPDFRIRLRLLRIELAAQRLARAVGIAIDGVLHHLLDVFGGASQPILYQQQVGAHVLGGARDELENGRQRTQRRHLPFAARLPVAARAAQLLEQVDRRER